MTSICTSVTVRSRVNACGRESLVSFTSANDVVDRSSLRATLPDLSCMLLTWSVLCLVILIACGSVSAAEIPAITSFPPDELRIFRGSSSQLGYYHALYFDQTSDYVYVGGMDVVYRLSAIDVQSASWKATNITSSSNYSSIYSSSVTACLQNDLSNPAVQCRNHIRTIYQVVNSNAIYICSTGAYNPQEFFLNASSLEVQSVGTPSSGKTKCPYDPSSIYAYVYSVSGNPFNVSSLYTAVAIDRNSAFVGLFRPTLLLSPFNPNQPISNLLRTDPGPLWINANAGPVIVVAAFDIGQYVYYFLREVALEVSQMSTQTYYSRVARVCKSDQGGTGLTMEFRFTTFLKARLLCHQLTPPSITSFVFNEIYDVYYNSSAGLFYALFMTNSDGRWGSAVCQYSLNDINTIFDTGLWAEQNATSQTWTVVPPRGVPSIRPGQCSAATKFYSAEILTFINTHLLMWGAVNPTTLTQPLYVDREVSFDKLVVDFVGNYAVLYLYSQARSELRRVASWMNARSQPQSSVLSIWKPFTSASPVTVWDMAVYTTRQGNRWIYMTTDAAVVQLSLEMCSMYKYCTDCARDPYCGWDFVDNVCSPFQPGLMQAVSGSAAEVLASCTMCSTNDCLPGCANRYVRSGTIPGMSLSMNCSTQCTGDTSTATWYFMPNGSSSASPVPVNVDSNYVLSRDNGLVILFVNASQHVGTFQCRSASGVVLSQHKVSLSECEYGESVRDVLINEFVKWCATFDIYTADYSRWRCRKDNCLTSNCANIGDNC